jgi:hypothetical protein
MPGTEEEKPPYGRAGLNAYYGNPATAAGTLNHEWVRQNIVYMPLPYMMRLAWEPETVVSKIAVHRKVVDPLGDALQEVWDACRVRVKKREGYDRDTPFYNLETIKEIRRLRLDLYGGGFNFRKKRGGSSLSTHSWGCAIDIDPVENGMGDATFRMPFWVAEIFEKRGFVWGGRWKGKSVDAMHFQYARGV